MDALDTIGLLNDAAAACVERGRVPKTGWIGADAFGQIIRHLETMARWESPQRLRLETVGGPIGLEVRASLFEHVIVEDTTGEPWIAP